jgi:hypothetical protein
MFHDKRRAQLGYRKEERNGHHPDSLPLEWLHVPQNTLEHGKSIRAQGTYAIDLRQKSTACFAFCLVDFIAKLHGLFFNKLINTPGDLRKLFAL